MYFENIGDERWDPIVQGLFIIPDHHHHHIAIIYPAYVNMIEGKTTKVTINYVDQIASRNYTEKKENTKNSIIA